MFKTLSIPLIACSLSLGGCTERELVFDNTILEEEILNQDPITIACHFLALEINGLDQTTEEIKKNTYLDEISISLACPLLTRED